MTSDFDSFNVSQPLSPEDCLASGKVGEHQPIGTVDMLKRDRFEMLSAYLDGEVTATERRQVEVWLETDPVVQSLYGRLLKLRQGIQTIPVPQPECPVEQTVEQVLSRVHRRSRRAILWGGAAIAALFVSILSNTLSGNQSPLPQLAASPSATPELASGAGGSSEALEIALDRPIMEIPKAPISAPARAVENPLYESNENVR